MYTGLLGIFVFLACDLYSCVAEPMQHRQAAFQCVPAIVASFAFATQNDMLQAKGCCPSVLFDNCGLGVVS